MEECLDKKMLHVARTKINKDVIVLYMLAKKYKLDLLSLLALYEIYDKDVFLFFYILSGSQDFALMEKDVDDINFGDSLLELPKETNLRLMFTKAKKVSDALRRNSERGLTTVTLPWYNVLKKYCMKSEISGENYINFYTALKEEPVTKDIKKVVKKKTTSSKKETKKEKVLA